MLDTWAQPGAADLWTCGLGVCGEFCSETVDLMLSLVESVDHRRKQRKNLPCLMTRSADDWQGILGGGLAVI